MTENAAPEAPVVEAAKPNLSAGDPGDIAKALKAQRTERQKEAARAANPEKPAVEKKATVKAEPQRPTAPEVVEGADAVADPDAPSDPAEANLERDADEAKPELEAADKPKEPEAKYKVLDGEGKETEVSVSELRSGYMRQADYTRKTQALSEERTRFQRDHEQFTQTKDNTLHELGVTAKMLVDALIAEESDGKLAELRNVDPAEWAARMQARQNKQDVLRRALAVANKARQDENDLRGRRTQEEHARLTAEENRRLVMAMPHWADKAAMEKGIKETQEYLVSQGYSRDEVGQLVDHRATLLARKAMAYDRLKAVGDTAKVEKREVDKAAKPAPTAPTVRKDSVSAKVTAQRERLHKTGSVDDAASLLKFRRQQAQAQLRR